MIEITRLKADEAYYAHLIAAENLDTFWTKESIEKEIVENKVARYLCAKEDGKVLGFCGAHIIFEEAHIINMAVDKNEQGRGIGSLLMSGILQYAANLGAQYMTLEVRASNAKAIALYEKFKFIKVGVRKGYYNGEDGYIMVLDKMPIAEENFTEEETIII